MKWWILAGLGLLVMAGGVMSNRVSARGLEHLKKQEGFRATAYQDEAGNWTIGYGHLITEDSPVSIVTKLSEADAEELLRQDLADAEAAVQRLVEVPLSQGQYDALVSFVFNVGAGALESSTLLRKLNAGDYDGAAQELERWNKITVDGQKRVSEILANRREAEQALWYA